MSFGDLSTTQVSFLFASRLDSRSHFLRGCDLSLLVSFCVCLRVPGGSIFATVLALFWDPWTFEKNSWKCSQISEVVFVGLDRECVFMCYVIYCRLPALVYAFILSFFRAVIVKRNKQGNENTKQI